jgi:hypothetical protein
MSKLSVLKFHVNCSKGASVLWGHIFIAVVGTKVVLATVLTHNTDSNGGYI